MPPAVKHHVVPGTRFGHLEVVSEVRIARRSRSVRGVLALCDCGRQKTYPLHAVISGNTRSCGCQNPRTPLLWGPHLWREDSFGCWVWQGRLNSGGYAMFGNVRANRKALMEKLGRTLVRKEVARHTCDRPECVNPEHLLPGTQSNNLDDAVARGRKKILEVGGVCAYGHDLVGPNVVRRTDTHGARIRCRECVNRASRDYQARKAKNG